MLNKGNQRPEGPRPQQGTTIPQDLPERQRQVVLAQQMPAVSQAPRHAVRQRTQREKLKPAPDMGKPQSPLK